MSSQTGFTTQAENIVLLRQRLAGRYVSAVEQEPRHVRRSAVVTQARGLVRKRTCDERHPSPHSPVVPP